MFSCKEYKSGLSEAINFYIALCQESRGFVHPIRQTEIEALKQRMNAMSTYPTLDTAVRMIVDRIAVPRHWYRFYIAVTESRLKSLLNRVIAHYQSIATSYEIEHRMIVAQTKLEQIAYDQKMITEKMIADFRANIKTLTTIKEVEPIDQVQMDRVGFVEDSIFSYCANKSPLSSNPSRG